MADTVTYRGYTIRPCDSVDAWRIDNRLGDLQAMVSTPAEGRAWIDDVLGKPSL